MGKAARTSSRDLNGSTPASNLYPGSDPRRAPPPRRGRGRAEGEKSLLGDLLDERRRIPLDEFRKRFVQVGEEGDGLRYALFHYLVAERYRALRDNSRRKFIEGPEHSHWPVPPEGLASSYMVMPVEAGREIEPISPFASLDVREERRGTEKGKGREKTLPPSMIGESEAVPLYQLLRPPYRRKNDHGEPPRQTPPTNSTTINVFRHGLLEGEVMRETRAPPHPLVTMDQSYGLYMALTGTTEKLWSPCMDAWQRTYGGEVKGKGAAERDEKEQDHSSKEQVPTMSASKVSISADEREGREGSLNILVTPKLDSFLKRAVAEQVQGSLSTTFDWCLDLIQWPIEGGLGSGRLPQYSLDARNVLMAAERAKIPSWILTRVKSRLRHLFPPMTPLE